MRGGKFWKCYYSEKTLNITSAFQIPEARNINRITVLGFYTDILRDEHK
jgi:hypothetical protein